MERRCEHFRRLQVTSSRLHPMGRGAGTSAGSSGLWAAYPVRISRIFLLTEQSLSGPPIRTERLRQSPTTEGRYTPEEALLSLVDNRGDTWGQWTLTKGAPRRGIQVPTRLLRRCSSGATLSMSAEILTRSLGRGEAMLRL